MNLKSTHLVLYTKLNSASNIFNRGDPDERAGFARSDSGIPCSIDLLPISCVAFWLENNTSWKNRFQRRKISHYKPYNMSFGCKVAQNFRRTQQNQSGVTNASQGSLRVRDSPGNEWLCSRPEAAQGYEILKVYFLYTLFRTAGTWRCPNETRIIRIVLFSKLFELYSPLFFRLLVSTLLWK